MSFVVTMATETRSRQAILTSFSCKMSRKSSLLLVISLTIAKIIICQEPSRICTCDLSPKYCDINCCCDSDCSESDLRIFPKCSVESTDVNSASLKYCTNAAQLIFKNVNYRSNSKNGLLCIYKDNYKEKLNFINTDPITTEEKFLEIKSLYGSLNSELLDSFHYDLADDYNLRSILPQSQYNVGNDILALTNNGILLKFPMPEGLLSEFCNYNALPKYFVDKQTVCLHSLHDIDTKCEVDPVLSAEWYYNRFSIVTTPKYLTSSAKESDQKFTTKIISNLPNFPSPKFNSTNRTCDNVVTAASYHFFINDNLDISNVTVDINLQSVPTLNKFFRRNFAISFTWLKAKEIVFKRSGNPGYKVGEPILAGERTVNGSEFTGVQLNADRNDWLTVMQSTGNGLCNSTKTVPIRFGENIITGCLMELTSAASAAECKSQQQLILERMKVNSVTSSLYAVF